MSQENVEIIKTIFAAWKERNPKAALKHIDPDIEVDFTGGSGVGGARPVARGVEELQAVVTDWLDAWGSLEFSPQNFIDAGDHVIVWLRLTGRGRESGAPVETNAAAVYSIDNGLVVRFRVYDTLAGAKDAVGI